ncbi:MAG TPA: ABC transporter permease [Bryobacteraceae bacterium]|nr:ABC transporter permease [Bryobacteraceae bacterium]HPQ13700.1 ABC transporter permease [Bryobacteraceae bacterium]
MTHKLVAENLRDRPLRTFLSILLIGVPVTLILSLVGLSQGMLDESARRARGIGADVLVRPPGSSALSLTGAPLPEELAARLEEEPHVAQAMGALNFSISGFTYIAGVNIQDFNRMSGGFIFLEGGPFQSPNDIIIDDYYARQHQLHAGGTISLLNRNWRVAGVVEPGKLSHLILLLDVLQELTGSRGRVTQIFLKLDDPANAPRVIASLRRLLPGYPIYSMEEFTSLFTVSNVPGLQTFIDVLSAIGVVIGFIVIWLSMHMAVSHRTREIGILKSLGASQWYIAGVVVAEALVLGVAGVIVGIALSFGARWLIHTLVPASLTMAIAVEWWPIVALITLGGVLLGALYPGIAAARQDAVAALSYE